MELTQQYREQIPALAKKKWAGYTETLNMPETAWSGFLEWISKEAAYVFSHQYEGIEACLGQLVRTEEERVLYYKRMRLWSKAPDYDGIYHPDEDPYV